MASGIPGVSIAASTGTCLCVERISAKHNPRVDEEMKKEVSSMLGGAPVEAHSEEFRDKEGPADGERLPSSRTTTDGDIPPGPVGRTELSRNLRLSVFPANRDELLEEARENHAAEPVLASLAGLPDGRRFATVFEVWQALGGNPELPEGRKDLHSPPDGQ